MQLKRRRTGFTLLETAVVLVIVASIAILTIQRFPTRQRQLYAERAFWQRLDVEWKQRVLMASVTGHYQLVKFDATGVVLGPTEKKGDEFSGSPNERVFIRLPATMSLKTPQKLHTIKIQKNGHPTLAVVVFNSKLPPKRTYKFSALMGWGAYRVAEIADAKGFYDDGVHHRT